MKKIIIPLLCIFLMLSSFVFGQDSLKQLNTRSSSFEQVAPSDSLTGSILLKPLSSIGYNESMEFYDAMFETIDKAAAADSAKNSFWGKVETGSEYLTKSTGNFTAGVTPVFLVLLALWFVLRFISVFILQPQLPEPQTGEEAEDE